jgi:hypothetical protein
VNALCDYAQFLTDEMSDRLEAEKLFRRAVEAAPRDANALCSLAGFL